MEHRRNETACVYSFRRLLNQVLECDLKTKLISRAFSRRGSAALWAILSLINTLIPIALLPVGLGFAAIATVQDAAASSASFISPRANCHGVRLVTIVAHMDDDLLFVDPAISQTLRSGGCVTSIYMIGGAGGGNFQYVLQREQASQAAYSRIIGANTTWTAKIITAGSANLMMLNADSKPELSFVYIRVKGGGVREGDVPLANMFDLGEQLNSWPYTNDLMVQGPVNTFSKASLTATLTVLINGFGATTVYALNPDTLPYVEHPDHIYSARFAREALRAIGRNIPVFYHETYSSSSSPPNVDPAWTQFKRDVVGTYLQYDYGSFSDPGGPSQGGTFSESSYNGSWVARHIFKMAHALDPTPTVSITPQPLVNLETQQCLASGGSGGPPTMQACTGSAIENWRFLPSGEPTGGGGTALLVSSAGNCVAYQTGGALIESQPACVTTDQTNLWTPWDFGKIFTPTTGGCLDIGASAAVAGNCPPHDSGRGYGVTTLWTRNVVNVESDQNVEAAMVGDVVGDGSNQLVQIIRRADGPGFNVWVSRFSAGSIISANWYQNGVTFDPASLTPSCGDSQICYDQTRYLLADFDGDGKADLMAITPRQGGTAFWLLKSTGAGFAAPRLYAQTVSTFEYGLAQQYLAGDFDGDGRIDVLIAHTRADAGLNFWVLTNTGSGLNGPVVWATATNISKSAKLLAAKLNSDRLTDIVAVDGVQTLRVTTFVSTGLQFAGFSPVRTYGFDPKRSRVVVANSRAGLSDLWVLTARNGGPNIDFWQLKLASDGTGFGAPLFNRTETSVAWSDIRAYPTTDGSQVWLPYRAGALVGEYEWSVGIMGVKSVNLLSPTAPATDYGITFPAFVWSDIQWRARLNSAQ